MKKITLFIAALLIGSASFAQVTPTNVGFSFYGQLLNLSNSYANSVYTDTVTNASTIYLTIPSGVSGSAYWLPGTGLLDVKMQSVVVSGTARGTIYLQSSADGSNWSTDNATNNFTIDSTGTTLTNTWHLTKNCPYHRLKIAQTGTGKNVYVGQYFYQKAQTISTSR